MTLRMIRQIAAVLAVLAGITAISGGVVAAQDGTPSAGVEQPVTVGETEVTWAEGWEVDSSSSTEEQIVLAQIDATTGTLKIATLAVLADDTVETTEEALDAFAGAFMDGAGATDVVVGESGQLENGAAWTIYSFKLGGLPLTFLVTVNETDDGAFVVTTLTGNSNGFEQAIEAAQNDILLNGEPVFFDGIDATEAVASLAAGATPEATPSS